MRIKHIEVFNAVMLTGTARAAARLLHVTQPALHEERVATGRLVCVSRAGTPGSDRRG